MYQEEKKRKKVNNIEKKEAAFKGGMLSHNLRFNKNKSCEEEERMKKKMIMTLPQLIGI